MATLRETAADLCCTGQVCAAKWWRASFVSYLPYNYTTHVLFFQGSILKTLNHRDTEGTENLVKNFFASYQGVVWGQGGRNLRSKGCFWLLGAVRGGAGRQIGGMDCCAG
jgi:hypothetical protein